MCLQIQDFNAKVNSGSKTLYKEAREKFGAGHASLRTSGNALAAQGPIRVKLHPEERALSSVGLAAGGTASGNGTIRGASRRIGLN